MLSLRQTVFSEGELLLDTQALHFAVFQAAIAAMRESHEHRPNVSALPLLRIHAVPGVNPASLSTTSALRTDRAPSTQSPRIAFSTQKTGYKYCANKGLQRAQRFCKPQVNGSNPFGGFHRKCLRRKDLGCIAYRVVRPSL